MTEGRKEEATRFLVAGDFFVGLWSSCMDEDDEGELWTATLE